MWNLGTLAVIVGTRTATHDVDVALNRAFIVLGSLFAANHLHAARRHGPRAVHLLSAAGNVAGVGGSIAALAGRLA